MSSSGAVEAAAGLSTRWAVQKKHEGVYTDSAAKVVLAPHSGDFLATWCSGDIALLHLSSGSMLGKIEAGNEDVEEQFSSFDVDPSDKFLATVARRSRLIQIWDLASMKEVGSWKASHALPVLDMAYSPTGMDLATCSADKSIVVYSVRREGVVTHRFATGANRQGHKSRVVRIFWHPSPKRMELVSCAEDGEMRLWKLSDSSSVLLSNHMGQVTSITFSKDGNTLISGGRDKVINVWSLAPSSYGHHIRTLPIYESVEGVSFLSQRPDCIKVESEPTNKNESYFTTAGSKGVLRTWSLSKLECVHSKEMPTAAAIGEAANADGSDSQLALNAAKYIANQVAHLVRIPARNKETTEDGEEKEAREEKLMAVTQEQNFYLYSTRTFRRLQLLIGFNDEIIDLKAHPNNIHALMASNSSQIRLVRIDNLQADLLSGHVDTVLAIDISPCGQYVVSASKDHTVRFWRLNLDAADGGDENVSECVAIGEGHTESVGCVTFSRNKHTGKLFAVSGARERILKLWDCSMLKNHTPGSPPLRLTAVASRLAHEKDINCLEVSPNDKLVASGSEDKMIRIWDTASCDLAPKAVLKGHRRGVWCIKFSPVDKVLASASGDKTIKLWSMEDYQCLKTLESHSASVKQVHFINAGMQLLSCGDDAVVKLWTIKTSECVATFEEAHDSKIWAMAVTPDQKHVLTGGSDSVLNIWTDVSAQDLEEEAAKKETFLLQEQQLSNLMRHKQYQKAVELTLELEQPRKCYTILQEIMFKEATAAPAPAPSTSTTAAPTLPPSELPQIVSGLSDDHLSRLILYIRDWNTHAKTSHVAQTLLSHLFRVISPSRLVSNRTLVQQSSSLALYSSRHFNRIDKLLTKSYIMDHMLNAMKIMTPDQSVQEQEEQADNEADAQMEAGVENKVDANSILQQLLASAKAASAANTSSSLRRPSAPSSLPRISTASASTSASDEEMGSEEEEGEGFDEDDDGSAWATNWEETPADKEEKESSEEEEEEEEEEEQPKQPAQKTPAKSKGIKLEPGTTPAATPAPVSSKKQKRKEPPTETAASAKKARPAANGASGKKTAKK